MTRYTIGSHSNVMLVSGTFMLRYLAKYVSKAEPGLRLTPKDYKKAEEQYGKLSDVIKYLNMRVLSKQEIVDLLFGHAIVRMRPGAFFLDCQLPENRYRYYTKRVSNIDYANLSAEQLLQDGIFEYYYARPAELQELTIFDFCASYSVTKKNMTNQEQ